MSKIYVIILPTNHVEITKHFPSENIYNISRMFTLYNIAALFSVIKNHAKIYPGNVVNRFGYIYVITKDYTYDMARSDFNYCNPDSIQLKIPFI